MMKQVFQHHNLLVFVLNKYINEKWPKCKLKAISTKKDILK